MSAAPITVDLGALDGPGEAAGSQRLAVTITEAAQLLDLSRPSIYTLIEAGELRCARFGGKIARVPLVDIYEILGLEFVDPTTV